MWFCRYTWHLCLPFGPQVLLQRFQITSNYSLDGVLDTLSSKNMTSAGPLDLINDYDSDEEDGVHYHSRGRTGYGLPGTTTNFGRPVARVKCIRLSATGRSWTAATTEGMIVYSIDDTLVFEPIDLDLDVTPDVRSISLAFVTLLIDYFQTRSLSSERIDQCRG